MYTYDCLLFSHSVISDSLRNCGLQHTRLPCPPSSPRACPNSCPLSQWCHPTYLVAFNFFQYQGLLKSVRSSHQVAKVLEFQAQHQSFQWIFRTDFLYDWLIWSPWSPRDSQSLLQHHNSKASILWHSAFFMVQLSHPYMTTGKTIALTTWTSLVK